MRYSRLLFWYKEWNMEKLKTFSIRSKSRTARSRTRKQKRLIRLQRMTDMHHHYFSKWTTTFCSFSENVSPNDGMLSIFVSRLTLC
ncbi:Vitamin D3 receptor [Trichinella pseudospiralis]